jgi:hypothetical protein
MRKKYFISILICAVFWGCGRVEPPKRIVAEVNDYQILEDDFESGFLQSPYAVRENKEQARKEYLDNLINQKLILQDAQKNNIDKQKEFLVSIERFWEQSLLTVALNRKAREISGSVHVRDEMVKKLYDQMIREGVATKSYQELYPQISWQAAKQLETAKLSQWVESLRQNAKVKIHPDFLQVKK